MERACVSALPSMVGLVSWYLHLHHLPESMREGEREREREKVSISLGECQQGEGEMGMKSVSSLARSFALTRTGSKLNRAADTAGKELETLPDSNVSLTSVPAVDNQADLPSAGTDWPESPSLTACTARERECV